MESLAFIAIAASVLGFGLVSGRIERSPVTPPMVFVALGLLLGAPFLGLVDFQRAEPFVETLAELTLVLVLFTDASRIELRLLRREHDLPVRALVIGLPFTIVLGTVVGALMLPALGLWGAAILAVILAPTDAALGQAVVSVRQVPARIRQALNVESGLNDGIVLPVLLIVLSLAGMAQEGGGAAYWLRFAALQLTLGPLAGLAVGYAGGRAVILGSRTGWMSRPFQELSALGLSLLAFAGAELVGGNGFIAAFTAGLTVGNSARGICDCLYEFAEAEGQLLALLVFMVFGATLAPDALRALDARALLYAVLSLTLIRMLPVAVSLLGTGLRLESVLFLGWFGPRGLATILFGMLVVERSGLAAREQVLAVAMLTVLLSVLAHGLTAYPGAQLYSRRLARLEKEAAEHVAVSEMRLRHSPHVQ